MRPKLAKLYKTDFTELSISESQIEGKFRWNNLDRGKITINRNTGRIDYRNRNLCDLSYIGLVPDAIGIGLGKFLFKTAILMAWDKTNIEKLTVNTCTLDNKYALPLYQKLGFDLVKFEDLKKNKVIQFN